ncbi:major facilitator superfamily domain-containing protein 6 [Procambarus clarkii]|uniref:major facilitator superfamily domain-containing protein 6 n=1 Tax=Procambarus clarkii TaxID=6728 RepID=UPI0037422484
MIGRPAWVDRVWKDFIKKEFIPVKILFFLLFGAMSTLFPFMTILARSLGIQEHELSIILAINPIIALLGPPITGLFADKIGNFKVLLSALTVSSGVAVLTFLAVPVGRQKIALPDLLPFNLTCAQPEDLHPHLSLQEPYKCDFLPKFESINLTLANCTHCTYPSSWGSAEEDGWRTVNASLARDTTTLEVAQWSCSSQEEDSGGWMNRSSGRSEAAAGCLAQCIAKVPREDLCSNTHTIQEFRPVLTYVLFLIMRLINGLTLATSMTLTRGAAMVILREHNGDYGLQRLCGSLGGIILTPISGLLMDATGEQDFRPAFYLYFGLKVLAGLVILTLNLDFRMPSKKVTKDAKSLLKNAEVLVYLVVMLISGGFFGLLDAFLFWLLQDLGAKRSLMGLTVTVGTAAGIPILVASASIISRLGHANTIILGLAFYVVRMIGYSFLTNPWWCMPFEALECFTVSLMETAAVSYADDLSTPSTIATLQGLYGGIHYGCGRALGGLAGGVLIRYLGIRNTFRGAAGVSAFACIIYFFVNNYCFSKQQEERKRIKEEMKKQVTKAPEDKIATEEITKPTCGKNATKQEYDNPAFEKDGNSTDIESATQNNHTNSGFEKET